MFLLCNKRFQSHCTNFSFFSITFNTKGLSSNNCSLRYGEETTQHHRTYLGAERDPSQAHIALKTLSRSHHVSLSDGCKQFPKHNVLEATSPWTQPRLRLPKQANCRWPLVAFRCPSPTQLFSSDPVAPPASTRRCISAWQDTTRAQSSPRDCFP